MTANGRPIDDDLDHVALLLRAAARKLDELSSLGLDGDQHLEGGQTLGGETDGDGYDG